jgi:hypothetical protein
MQMLDSKSINNNSESRREYAQATGRSPKNNFDEDIPF